MRRPTPLPVPAWKAPEPAAAAPSSDTTGSVAVRARNEDFEPIPVIEPVAVTDATRVDEPGPSPTPIGSPHPSSRTTPPPVPNRSQWSGPQP